MEIRQEGKCAARPVRFHNLIRELRFLTLHTVEQDMIEMRLRAERHCMFRKSLPRIEERGSALSESIIGIGEIAIISRADAVLLNFRREQGEIAHMLLVHAPCGIADMTDRKRCRLLIKNRLSPHLLESFMYASLVEQPAPKTDKPDMRRTPDLTMPVILIHMHDRQENGIHVRHQHIHHREIWSHLTGIKECLVCIKNRRPCAGCMGKRGIARSGKIIRPCKVIDIRARAHGNLPRSIRRSRIEHKALIRI